MGRDSFGLSVVAAILCIVCEGCASAPPEGYSIPSASASRDPSATHRTATNHVAAAVAYDDGTPGPIRQTADVWKQTSEAVKRGLDRVAQAASPNSTSAAEPADDPTSLRTQSKPSPELFIAAAQVHESAGRIPQAESAFQQAFRLSPKHLPTHLAYARFKDRQKQSREALEIYQRLAQEYPNEATVFNDLGLYYARRGINREAIAAFDRAVQLQPKRPLYRNNYAVALVQSDQIEAAMLQLLAAYTEAEACYKLGYLLQKKGDNALAMEYFGRAVQLEPRMVEARQWYEHLRSRSGPSAPREASRSAVADLSPPPAPASEAAASGPAPRAVNLRVAERPKPDIALPPSKPNAPSGEPSLTVRQLPPAPKRLPATRVPGADRGGAAETGEAPMPPPTSVDPTAKGQRADHRSPPRLPDAPLPPDSRPVPLPPVSKPSVKPIPPVAP